MSLCVYIPLCYTKQQTEKVGGEQTRFSKNAAKLSVNMLIHFCLMCKKAAICYVWIVFKAFFKFLLFCACEVVLLNTDSCTFLTATDSFIFGRSLGSSIFWGSEISGRLNSSHNNFNMFSH